MCKRQYKIIHARVNTIMQSPFSGNTKIPSPIYDRASPLSNTTPTIMQGVILQQKYNTFIRNINHLKKNPEYAIRT